VEDFSFVVLFFFSGAMHAILFQIALIPLTMSKYTAATLSNTRASRFIPMNRMLLIHIHLGYIMVTLVFLSTVLFLTFFGILCADGEDAFCHKLKSEIMITGYIIIGVLLIIGGTSYFRHSMPYEVFYAIHHLIFLLYFITIVHTMDQEQRSGAQSRSQTFKWFSSTLLYYFCDRAAIRLNHYYQTPLVASSIIYDGSEMNQVNQSKRSNNTTNNTTNNSRGKMLILRIRRPVLFHFKPGQYAQLRVKEIDHQWHPFSIASAPGSSSLEFYIEVCENGSWTDKLWNLLQKETTDSNRCIEFELMGAYGTALAPKTDDYSHVIAIGAGTGIVPILSLFKQHLRQLLRLEPETFLRNMQERQRRIIQVECAQEMRKGSLVAKACCPRGGKQSAQSDPTEAMSKRHQMNVSLRTSIDRHCEMKQRKDVRSNMRDMKKAAFVATRSVYGVVLLSTLPVLGVAIFGLTISFNTCSIELCEDVIEFLCALTIFFQVCFAFVALFIWDGNHFFALLDAAVSMIAPFADWY